MKLVHGGGWRVYNVLMCMWNCGYTNYILVNHRHAIIDVVSSPDHAPLATQGNGLATIEAFLVSDDVY